MKKKSTISWVMEFAGRRKGFFIGSVLLAILGVAASFIPYLLIAGVVEKLISGGADWSYYLRQVLIMAACWIVRVALHSSSTTLSHVATFTVLGGIRKQLTAKLSKIPLGSVLDDHSGTYKNIIVERVDSMETTMAHIIPEFTANILLPLVMFIYLLTIDWRMGLAKTRFVRNQKNPMIRSFHGRTTRQSHRLWDDPHHNDPTSPGAASVVFCTARVSDGYRQAEMV